jgi:[citrate (pro-3S)-lyase] ligase
MLMCQYWGIPCIDLQPLVDRPHEMGEIFLDHFHWSFKLNEKIASYILNILNSAQSSYDIHYDIEKSCTQEMQKIVKSFFSTKQILEYIKNVKSKYDFTQYNKIGCIVMNANPFTNGHLHLVQYAIKYVEALYIFVVEDNLSYFDFNDRFHLVKSGIENIEAPICVVPSGKFIISSFTFPDYFTKETKPMNYDSSFDILLFASVIAPGLGITDRFVADEPVCQVSAQYNTYMKKYFQYMGLDLHVIDRKRVNGAVISASLVRKHYADNALLLVKNLVPITTYRFLQNHCREKI